MAAGDLNVALILKLVDQVTAPIRPIMGQLRKVGELSDKTGRAGVEWSNRQLEANQARTAALRGEAFQLAALAGGLFALTEPAVQAEKRMAEVSKVVNFAAPDGLKILQDDIRELVTTGGLATTAAGITDIVAAAGRMGVVDENLPDAEKRRQLLEFATAASKMGVAFGISADEAGTTLARWRQNLGLTQDEAMALGDVVNLLGNTMATNEADILQVINRQGVVAKSAGLASNQIAALSATLLAAGASPEIAATGLKNFTNALVKGESVTKRQQMVFNELGIDAVALSKRMQTDAAGGILDVLAAFEKIEPHRRNSLVGDLFGEEAKGAIMPLIANADMLREAFEKTADASSLLGLMEDEYQRQAATTFAQRQRLLEYVKGLSVTIGTVLLPQINALMATIMPLVGQFTEWAAAHPELVSAGFRLVLALMAIKAVSIGLRWSFFSLLTPFLHITHGVSWLLRLLPALGAGLGILARLKPLRWAALIPKLAWAAFLTPIAWVALAGRLVWRTLIWPFKWTARFLPKIPWRGLAKMLSWRNLVRPLVWSARFIPKIRWAALGLGVLGMTTGGWGMLVKPLAWAAKIGGRALIGPIGWALLAGELLWSLLLSKLPWSDWIDQIDWSDWFSFRWADKLPKWIWSEIIPPLNLLSVIGSPSGGGGTTWKPSDKPGAAAATGPMQPPRADAPGAFQEPMRDAGGPVRAGMPYWVGERGRELFIPGVSGSILPTRVLKAAAMASAMATPAAALPSQAEIMARIDPRPAMQAMPQASQITKQGDTINITIAPPPGSDAAEIARLVRRELDRREDARRGDLHDGVDY